MFSFQRYNLSSIFAVFLFPGWEQCFFNLLFIYLFIHLSLMHVVLAFLSFSFSQIAGKIDNVLKNTKKQKLRQQ